MSNFHLSVLAGDNMQSQDENTSIKIGDTFRFKYDILRINGTTKSVEITLISIKIWNKSLTIREGDIAEIVVYNISTEFVNQYISFWISIEGSTQERIAYITNYPTMFFAMSSDESFYQNEADNINNFVENDAYESIKAFVENDRYYTKVYYNQSKEYNIYEYLENEIFIPRRIFSCYNVKIIADYSGYRFSEYDHLRIVSLDFPPIYAEDRGFDLLEFIMVDLVGLVTNPFFYIILAELGGLVILIKFLRKKGAF